MNIKSVEARPNEWYSSVKYGKTGQVARKKTVEETLPTAYCFLRHQIRALTVWDNIASSPRPFSVYPLEIEALVDFSSHYNNVYTYMGDCINGGIPSLSENQNYKQLLQTTKDGYRNLEIRRLRNVMFKSGNLKNSETPISLDELRIWLIDQSTKRKGVVTGFGVNDPLPNRTPDIPKIKSIVDLNRYIYLNQIDNKKVRWDDNSFTQVALEKLSKDTHELAVYKMACGMAVIVQLTQESSNLGLPVAATYRYEFEDDSEYQKPSNLADLWHQAHTILHKLSDPKDELLKPLLTLNELKSLI